MQSKSWLFLVLCAQWCARLYEVPNNLADAGTPIRWDGGVLLSNRLETRCSPTCHLTKFRRPGRVMLSKLMYSCVNC